MISLWFLICLSLIICAVEHFFVQLYLFVCLLWRKVYTNDYRLCLLKQVHSFSMNQNYLIPSAKSMHWTHSAEGKPSLQICTSPLFEKHFASQKRSKSCIFKSCYKTRSEVCSQQYWFQWGCCEGKGASIYSSSAITYKYDLVSTDHHQNLSEVQRG